MAQASAWIQEEIDVLEGQVEELEEEIRGVEDKMRAEEATRVEGTSKRVFKSRRGLAWQLGSGRREAERRAAATEGARRAVAGCREQIEAGKKRQRSIEIAAKLKELDEKVGRYLKNAADSQRLAMEFRKEMGELMEEQQRLVGIFGVDWARLLEEIREVSEGRGRNDDEGGREGDEGEVKGEGNNMLEWGTRAGGFADEEENASG